MLDCDGNYLVNTADFECSNAAGITTELLAELNLLAGDLDFQDGVGFSDFVQFSANFGLSLGRYVDGDFDGSGDVGFSDYLMLAANFGRQGPDAAMTASVPEPVSGIMFVLGGACLLSRVSQRRRRR